MCSSDLLGGRILQLLYGLLGRSTSNFVVAVHDAHEYSIGGYVLHPATATTESGGDYRKQWVAVFAEHFEMKWTTIHWLPTAQSHLVEIDADHWKTWVHQRFTTPTTNPGSITLFQATPSEHLAFAKHLTAEVKTEEFISGKGMVAKWERRRKQNHWFDALYNACAAGHYCGVRLVEEIRPEPKPNPKQEPNPSYGVMGFQIVRSLEKVKF